MKTKIFITFLAFILFGFGQIFAQSTIQEYPTAVTSNEITGKIVARDVGDSRQTAHFYTFNGTQGDLFINIETNNLNADFDLFTLADLRPLTKIVVYAGSEPTETGRVVFVRKDEKLLLRVKGRTPNDDAGTYRIKFAGSFVAITDSNTEKVEIPTVKEKDESEIKVNSVGTKIEVKPKPSPNPKETVAKKEEDEKTVQTPQNVSTTGKKVKPSKTPTSVESNKKEEVKSTTEAKTETPKTEKTVKPKVEKTKEETAKVEEKKDEKKSESTAKNQPDKKAKVEKTKKPKTEEKSQPKTLEKIKLVILFRDGTKFERKMDEVNHVGVDKGILTIITNKGEVLRYSILDVEKMTIE
jgi:translation initiation factor IF-2